VAYLQDLRLDHLERCSNRARVDRVQHDLQPAGAGDVTLDRRLPCQMGVSLGVDRGVGRDGDALGDPVERVAEREVRGASDVNEAFLWSAKRKCG
jgi:hypothetical protein